MKPRLGVFLAGAVLCGGLNCVAFAQPATTRVQQTPLLPPEGNQTHPIRVKNMSASLMAWWLDPANQPVPKEMQSSLLLDHEKLFSKATPADLGKGVAPLPAGVTRSKAAPTKIEKDNAGLPAGVTRIVPIDPQNAILVYGTEAGAREIEKLVAFLDKPMRQIEVEAQFAQLDPQDMKAFGIESNVQMSGQLSAQDLKALRAGNNKLVLTPKRFQIGFVRGNFNQTMSQLVMQKKARIITAPRVVTYNNFTASLESFEPVSLNLLDKESVDYFKQMLDGTKPSFISYGMIVTPTINADDTVTILMSTSVALNDKGKPREGLETIANVRSGDTVALTGFPAPLSPVQQTPQALPRDIVVFVTTRIVRRAGEDVQPIALKR